MCMSESEACGLLHDVKWSEFADVSERLAGPIMFQKNGRCKKFGYIKVEAWEEFKCFEMWPHQSGEWSDNTSRNFGDLNIQGVPGGMCQTSGGCSLC